MKQMLRLVVALAVAGGMYAGTPDIAGAQTPAPADAAKPETTKPEAAKPEAAKPDAAKKPTKAELGEMLKKCSEEADAKGLTMQKGKAEARKAYRRSCMLKNGVAPNPKKPDGDDVGANNGEPLINAKLVGNWSLSGAGPAGEFILKPTGRFVFSYLQAFSGQRVSAKGKWQDTGELLSLTEDGRQPTACSHVGNQTTQYLSNCNFTGVLTRKN